MNSIGLSSVMMCNGHGLVDVVDRGGSVGATYRSRCGPVTSTRPHRTCERYVQTLGRPSFTIVGMSMGMTRNTAPIELRSGVSWARSATTGDAAREWSSSSFS